MRTTLTLDDDLAMDLQAKARREGRSLKDVVNEAIRRGLQQGIDSGSPPYRVRAVDMGLKPGIDLAASSDLLGVLDDERFLRVLDQDRQDEARRREGRPAE